MMELDDAVMSLHSETDDMANIEPLYMSVWDETHFAIVKALLQKTLYPVGVMEFEPNKILLNKEKELTVSEITRVTQVNDDEELEYIPRVRPVTSIVTKSLEWFDETYYAMDYLDWENIQLRWYLDTKSAMNKEVIKLLDKGLCQTTGFQLPIIFTYKYIRAQKESYNQLYKSQIPASFQAKVDDIHANLKMNITLFRKFIENLNDPNLNTSLDIWSEVVRSGPLNDVFSCFAEQELKFKDVVYYFERCTKFLKNVEGRMYQPLLLRKQVRRGNASLLLNDGDLPLWSRDTIENVKSDITNLMKNVKVVDIRVEGKDPLDTILKKITKEVARNLYITVGLMDDKKPELDEEEVVEVNEKLFKTVTEFRDHITNVVMKPIRMKIAMHKDEVNKSFMKPFKDICSQCTDSLLQSLIQVFKIQITSSTIDSYSIVLDYLIEKVQKWKNILSLDDVILETDKMDTVLKDDNLKTRQDSIPNERYLITYSIVVLFFLRRLKQYLDDTENQVPSTPALSASLVETVSDENMVKYYDDVFEEFFDLILHYKKSKGKIDNEDASEHASEAAGEVMDIDQANLTAEDINDAAGNDDEEDDEEDDPEEEDGDYKPKGKAGEISKRTYDMRQEEAVDYEIESDPGPATKLPKKDETEEDEQESSADVDEDLIGSEDESVSDDEDAKDDRDVERSKRFREKKKLKSTKDKIKITAAFKALTGLYNSDIAKSTSADRNGIKMLYLLSVFYQVQGAAFNEMNAANIDSFKQVLSYAFKLPPTLDPETTFTGDSVILLDYLEQDDVINKMIKTEIEVLVKEHYSSLDVKLWASDSIYYYIMGTHFDKLHEITYYPLMCRLVKRYEEFKKELDAVFENQIKILSEIIAVKCSKMALFGEIAPILLSDLPDQADDITSLKRVVLMLHLTEKLQFIHQQKYMFLFNDFYTGAEFRTLIVKAENSYQDKNNTTPVFMKVLHFKINGMNRKWHLIENESSLKDWEAIFRHYRDQTMDVDVEKVSADESKLNRLLANNSFTDNVNLISAYSELRIQNSSNRDVPQTSQWDISNFEDSTAAVPSNVLKQLIDKFPDLTPIQKSRVHIIFKFGHVIPQSSLTLLNQVPVELITLFEYDKAKEKIWKKIRASFVPKDCFAFEAANQYLFKIDKDNETSLQSVIKVSNEIPGFTGAIFIILENPRRLITSIPEATLNTLLSAVKQKAAQFTAEAIDSVKVVLDYYNKKLAEEGFNEITFSEELIEKWKGGSKFNGVTLLDFKTKLNQKFGAKLSQSAQGKTALKFFLKKIEDIQDFYQKNNN